MISSRPNFRPQTSRQVAQIFALRHRSQVTTCATKAMGTASFIRRIIILWAIFSVPALTASAQQKPDDVVRVNTELVQTDFMVFDKQGNFVDGLKRDQFVFKVEGKPREISFFDRIAAGSRSEEAQLAAARGSNATGAAPVPMDRGRTVLFFIDDLHLSP